MTLLVPTTTQQNKFDACVHERQCESATCPGTYGYADHRCTALSAVSKQDAVRMYFTWHCLRNAWHVLHCHHQRTDPSTFGSHLPCSASFEHLQPNCVLYTALAFLVHICVIDQQSRTPYLHTLRQTCNHISDVHEAMDKHKEARPDSCTDAWMRSSSAHTHYIDIQPANLHRPNFETPLPLSTTRPSIPLSYPLCTTVTRTVTQHPSCAVTPPSMIDHQAPLSFEYQDPPAPLIIRRAYGESTLPLAFPLAAGDVFEGSISDLAHLQWYAELENLPWHIDTASPDLQYLARPLTRKIETCSLAHR
jgi:hypothetical protein